MQEWVRLMLEQQQENERILKVVERELKHAPAGDLRVSHYRGKARFYRSKVPDGKDEYLGEKEAALCAALAQKKYDREARVLLLRELKAMEYVTRHTGPSLEDVYDSLPAEIQALVEPHVLPDEEYARRWLEKWSAGASEEDFKSRIEIIIDNYYEKYGAPHVYEPYLYLEGYGPVRPDFVVLNLRTRKMYFHEHFGMMDDPDYRAKNLQKLRAYHNNGFYEGINLIVTMEADGKMIDRKELEQLILTYVT